jgi:hypothetical protein
VTAAWYLRFTYLTGPEAGTSESIGPFRFEVDAVFHREMHGPGSAVVVTEPSPTNLSPAQARAMMEQRS